MSKSTIDFCNWLSGVLDMMPEGQGLTAAQTKKIKDKLDSIFEHVVEHPPKPTPPEPPQPKIGVRC